MTIKILTTFLVGVVFIIGSIIKSAKKIKVWKTLSGKEKYDAVMWVLIGVVFCIIVALIGIIFLLE